MESIFVDREVELAWLEDLYKREGAQLAVLYGRRRLGKTALAVRFLQGKKGIYHMCTYDSIEKNVKELLGKLAQVTGEGYLARLVPPFSSLAAPGGSGSRRARRRSGMGLRRGRNAPAGRRARARRRRQLTS